jgi:hypothetical protein
MNLGRRDTDDVARVELRVAMVQLRAPRIISIGVRPLDAREEPRRERQAVSRGQREKALFEVFRELRLGHSGEGISPAAAGRADPRAALQLVEIRRVRA